MGQHALWRDSPHAERRRIDDGEEAASTLTKIDTLSDRLLSSQLLHLQDYNRAIWIAPRYRNATPSTHPMISHESLEMESLQVELSN